MAWCLDCNEEFTLREMIAHIRAQHPAAFQQVRQAAWVQIEDEMMHGASLDPAIFLEAFGVQLIDEGTEGPAGGAEGSLGPVAEEGEGPDGG